MPRTSTPNQQSIDDPRADIAAAFEKISAAEEDPGDDTEESMGSAGEEEQEADETTGTGEDDSEESEESSGESGEAGEGDEDESESGDEDESSDGKPAKKAADVDKQDKGAGESKAPASWDPAVREHWTKLPPAVRAQVEKREKEVSQALGQSANARRFASEFQSVVQPYEGILRAQGATGPLEAVHTLLQTSAGLQLGSQQQKAQILAGIIRDFDVDLRTLDAFLAGTIKPGENNDVERLLNEKLKPFQDLVTRDTQQSQERRTQVHQSAANEIQTFMSSKEAEFMEDVRVGMADILDMASKRGESMSIQEAYRRACLLDPKISKIIDQRRKVKEAKRKQGTIRGKKTAASSIRGRAGTGAPMDDSNAGNGFDDVRSDIAKAWDANNSSKRRRI